MWNILRTGAVKNEKTKRSKRLETRGRGCFDLFTPLLLSLALGCSTAPKTESPSLESHEKGSPLSESGEGYGPAPLLGAEGAPTEAGTQRAENPDRVVLVFGQGLSHGYAYVGVLRALTELKVPVHAIYATEMGALAAALYYTQPNPNRMDWALLRFTEKNLRSPEGKFPFVRLNSPEQDLEGRLREVFGTRDIGPLSDRLKIFVEDEKTGETLQPTSGEVWKIVRAALAGVNEFSPLKHGGRSLRSSSARMSDVFRKANSMERYPVIAIGAGSQSADVRREVEREDGLFIQVDLPGISDLDLKKRNQAMFFGKSAIQRSAEKILGLIGRSSE